MLSDLNRPAGAPGPLHQVRHHHRRPFIAVVLLNDIPHLNHALPALLAGHHNRLMYRVGELLNGVGIDD